MPSFSLCSTVSSGLSRSLYSSECSDGFVHEVQHYKHSWQWPGISFQELNNCKTESIISGGPSLYNDLFPSRKWYTGKGQQSFYLWPWRQWHKLLPFIQSAVNNPRYILLGGEALVTFFFGTNAYKHIHVMLDSARDKLKKTRMKPEDILEMTSKLQEKCKRKVQQAWTKERRRKQTVKLIFVIETWRFRIAWKSGNQRQVYIAAEVECTFLSCWDCDWIYIYIYIYKGGAPDHQKDWKSSYQ